MHPTMRPRVALLVVAVYWLLLVATSGRRIGGLPADLTVALGGLPAVGWAGCVLLDAIYARAERYGLALPATMLGMFGGFTLILWVVTRILLR